MTDSSRAANLLAQLEHLNEQKFCRLLVDHLTRPVNDDGSTADG